MIGAREHRFAFFSDTGTGKTFLSIALMRYFAKADVAQRNLILVPNKVNKTEWALEGFDKHAPNMRYVVLTGSSKHKWELIEENSDASAFIDTYAGFVRMLCDRQQLKKKKGNRTHRLVPNRKRVQMLAEFFDGVYCDESTYLADRRKLPYRVVKKFSQFAEVFFILTATPFGRNVEQVWSQMHLVDGGETLGETLTLFRSAFFDTKINYWGGYEYTLKKDGRREISRFLDHKSITYPAKESDLPRLVRERKYVALPETAEAYYQRARDELRRSMGNQQAVKNAFLRMRQISSGFVGYKDDESGERAEFVFDKNPKLDLLEALVMKIPEQYKFIVFHEFHYSAHVISKMLDRLNIKHVLINGMRKDSDKARRLFRADNNVRGLVLSNSAGGYGLNLQIARYGLYYESPVPVILRKQTEKRFDRQYSPHDHVFLWDLIVRGTADESILEFHKEGKNLWKAILNVDDKKIFDR